VALVDKPRFGRHGRGRVALREEVLCDVDATLGLVRVWCEVEAMPEAPNELAWRLFDQRGQLQERDAIGRMGVKVLPRPRGGDGSGARRALCSAVRSEASEHRDGELFALKLAAQRIEERHAETCELGAKQRMMNHEVTRDSRGHRSPRVARRDCEPIGVRVDEAVAYDGGVPVPTTGVYFSRRNEQHGASWHRGRAAAAPEGGRAFVDHAEREGVVCVAVERVRHEAGLEDLDARQLRDSLEANLVGVEACHARQRTAQFESRVGLLSSGGGSRASRTPARPATGSRRLLICGPGDNDNFEPGRSGPVRTSRSDQR
jgi:hypothetical protein